MSLTIELSPEMERRLHAEAARKGQQAAEYARVLLEQQLAAAEREGNQGLRDLLRQWREEPPDLEEAEGYPTEITPLSLRQITIE
jgi:hypothetical protein